MIETIQVTAVGVQAKHNILKYQLCTARLGTT